MYIFSKVSAMLPHPTNFLLELAVLDNVDAVVVTYRDVLSVGTPVIYLPPGLVMPDPVIDVLGRAEVVSRLGPENTVVRFSVGGVVSDGYVITEPQLVAAYPGISGFSDQRLVDIVNLVEYAEPPFPAQFAPTDPLLEEVPPMVYYSASIYASDLVKLAYEPVVIQERLNGASFAFSHNLDGSASFVSVDTGTWPANFVSSSSHPFAQALRAAHVPTMASRIADTVGRMYDVKPDFVTLRGTVVGNGVHGNPYGLPGLRVFFHSVEHPSGELDAFTQTHLLLGVSAPVLPVHALGEVTLHDWAGNRRLSEIADVWSGIEVGPTPVFGLVIRPALKTRSELKTRAPQPVYSVSARPE